MKTHIYFREDTQEIKYLPIVEGNCYYLGEFSINQISAIKSYIELSGPLSFYELSSFINNHKSEIDLEN